MVLLLVAVMVLGLMCGSELNMAVFAHPTLNRQPFEVHIMMRQSLAELLGRVMPFWMGGSTLLNLLLLLPIVHLNEHAWRLCAAAFAIQAVAVVLSLVGPVPINNRIVKWTPDSVPDNWREEESRWDWFHWIRTCGLGAAFALLVLAVGAA